MVEQQQTWYEMQRQRDEEALALSEPLWGPEKEVFSNAMGIVSKFLDSILEPCSVNDFVVKSKLAIATHAFDLLWSSWNEASVGRYGAATDHWRSIEESPDFLKALQINPALAQELRLNRMDKDTAVRTIRKALDAEKPGAGQDFFQSLDYRKVLQRFSHVTYVSTLGTLPIYEDEEGARVLVKPGGGVISEESLRRIGVYLAEAAMNLVSSTAFAFQDVEDVSRLWECEGRSLIEESRPTLAAVAKELGLKV